MSLPNPLYSGTAINTQVTFTVPPSTTPVDPDTITLKYKAGASATATWVYAGAGSITKVSTGIYAASLDTTSTVGTWVIEWIGTGACAAVTVSQVLVQTPPL